MLRQDYIELCSALLAGNTVTVESRIAGDDFDFDRFRAFTNLHQLSGYLYLLVKGSPLEDLLPQAYLEQLGERYALQRKRCNDILKEAAIIHDTFSAAHVPVLFLKGPFVAQQFYGDIHQRSYMDIDILIHREDLSAADMLLKEAGFKRLSMVLISNGAMTRFTHTYDYHKRIAGPDLPVHRQYLPLDLHWRLRSHFSFRLDYETIWRQHKDCRLGGRAFPVLSAEYALVMNLLGLFFDVELGTIRLKSFFDLYKMLDALDPVMDWDAFLSRRSEENISGIVLNVIDLMLVVLECRSRFPRVASLVRKNRRYIRLADTADKYRLLERSRSALYNRRWAHALYQAPVLHSMMWTLASLPFRVACHDRNLSRVMKRM